MIKNFLKIAFRNLVRYKVYSFINITGLAVGLACFILVILYVCYEFSYESQHKNADKIFSVNVIQQHPKGAFKSSHTMVPLGKTLLEELPEVRDFARIDNAGKHLVTYEDKIFNEDNMIFTDQGLFNMFTIPILRGNQESALKEKFSVVITESGAKKYFGDQDPVSQILMIDNEVPLKVTAVVEDFPSNTHIEADFLISFKTLVELAGDDILNNWVTINLSTYILMPEIEILVEIEEKINKVYLAHNTPEVQTTLKLEKLNRIHLYSEFSSYGDIQYIYIFLAIGILILLIASINFMNLSTSRSTNRANEIGLRKIVGASRSQLIGQFLGESILISFLALFLSLAIVDLVLPLFENITARELFLPALADWNFYGLLLLITIAVGFLSGSYPALYLSSFNPANILRGKKSSGGKDVNLRRLLVVLQFSIAIVLIICTITIGSQIDFMRNKDIGFQKNQIIIVPIYGGDLRNDLETFKHELLNHENIIAAAGSLLLPSKIGMFNNVTWEGAAENESIALIQNKVDYDFLDTYEIKVTDGRNFSREFPSDAINNNREGDSGAMILNEEAVRRFGWDNPIGKKVIQVYGEERYYFNVVGVIKDFHFASLHTKIKPLSLFLRSSNSRYISIKVKPTEIRNTIAYIKDTWNKFNPAYPFEYFFLDETFDRIYQSEEKLQALFNCFSLLSIFISCLGLFGLTAFTTKQRTKEIGIRKVLGASMSSVVGLISREFIWLVFISMVIAWPVAWYIANRWLVSFAYRIEIEIWIFLLAGLLVLMIALLTVSYQSIKAALTNPVETLRYE
jgi:putative ABC transport system permease protein